MTEHLVNPATISATLREQTLPWHSPIPALVNKFKLKYGNNANISKFIDNEVQKFLANDRLTETNLLGLDEKIGKEAN